MQPKVSIAMPCYNKEQYIGKMFDSIIAQKWDNIELILVNDGSTDGTRNVIADYEPKFKARGYDVVIVDQKNAGVCAAAKAGLERVTGDYVCCIDADDMLDQEYVSLPVSFLEENRDYDYTACSYQTFTIDDEGKQILHSKFQYLENQKISPEIYMLHNNIVAAVWAYMLRIEYLKKCRIAETYFINTKGSHEPGFMIPLIAFDGKVKFLKEKPLYFFQVDQENSHACHNTLEKAIAHANEYLRLCDIAINLLPENVSASKRKIQFKKIYKLSQLITTRLFIIKFTEIETERDKTNALLEKILIEIINFVNDYLPLQNQIKRTYIPQRHEHIFIKSVISHFYEDAIQPFKELNLQKFPKRIIFYGVLGKRGEALLPALLKFDTLPIEFWDKNGGNGRVKLPNFSELNEDDMLVVIPANKTVVEDIKQSLKNSKCNNIISYDTDFIYLHICISQFL